MNEKAGGSPAFFCFDRGVLGVQSGSSVCREAETPLCRCRDISPTRGEIGGGMPFVLMRTYTQVAADGLVS